MENDVGSDDNKSNKSLPNTARVCSKILEYYKKFGYKRDLEKYLRLYSPSEENNDEKPFEIAARTTKSKSRVKTNSDYQSNDYERSLKSLKAANINTKETSKQKKLKKSVYLDEATDYSSAQCSTHNILETNYDIKKTRHQKNSLLQATSKGKVSPSSLNLDISGKALTSTKVGVSKISNKDDDKCSQNTYLIESAASITKQNFEEGQKPLLNDKIISATDKVKQLDKSEHDRKMPEMNIVYNQKHSLSKTRKGKEIQNTYDKKLKLGKMFSSSKRNQSVKTQQSIENGSATSFYSEILNVTPEINEEQLQFFSKGINSSCIDLEIDLVVRLLSTLINSRQLNERHKRQIMRYVVKHISRLTGGGATSNKMNNINLNLKKSTGGYHIRNTSSDSSIAQLYRVQSLRQGCGEKQQSVSTQALPGSKVIENNGSNGESNTPEIGTLSKKSYSKLCSDTSISNECIIEVKVYKKPEQKIQVEKKRRKKKNPDKNNSINKEDEEYVEEEDTFYTSQELEVPIDIIQDENEETEDINNDANVQHKTENTISILKKEKKKVLSDNTSESEIKVHMNKKKKQDLRTASQQQNKNTKEAVLRNINHKDKEGQKQNTKEHKNIRKSGGCNKTKHCKHDVNNEEIGRVLSNASLLNKLSLSATSSKTTIKSSLVPKDWLYPLTKSEIAFEIDALKNRCSCDNNNNGTSNSTDKRLNYVEDKIRYLQSLKQLLLQEQRQQNKNSINHNEEQQSPSTTEKNYNLVKENFRLKKSIDNDSEFIEIGSQDTYLSPQNSMEDCLEVTSNICLNSDICNEVKFEDQNEIKQPMKTRNADVEMNEEIREVVENQLVNIIEQNSEMVHQMSKAKGNSLREDPSKKITDSFISFSEEDYQKREKEGNDDLKDVIINREVEDQRLKNPNKEKLSIKSDQWKYKQIDSQKNDSISLDRDEKSFKKYSVNSRKEQIVNGLEDTDIKKNENTQTYQDFLRVELSKRNKKERFSNPRKNSKSIYRKNYSHDMNNVIYDEEENNGVSLSGLYLDIPIELEKDLEYCDDKEIIEDNEDEVLFSIKEQMAAVDTPSLSGSGDDYDFNYLIQQRTNQFMNLYHKKEVELCRLQKLYQQYEKRVLKYKFNSGKQFRISGGEEKKDTANLYLKKKPQITMTATAMTTTTTTTTSSASMVYLSSEIFDNDNLVNGETCSGTSKNAMSLGKIETDHNGYNRTQRHCSYNSQHQEQQKHIQVKKQSTKQRHLQGANNGMVDKKSTIYEKKVATSTASSSIIVSEKRIPAAVTSSIISTESQIPCSTYTLSENSINVKPKSIAFAVSMVETQKGVINGSKNIDRKVLQTEKEVQQKVKSNADYIELKDKKFLTLQECLARAKPQFLKESQQRKNLLTTMQKIRSKRQRCIRDFIDQINSNNDLSSSNNNINRCNVVENGGSSHGENKKKNVYYNHISIPPPATKCVRILDAKEMKARTQRNFHKLPEVVAKKQRECHEKFKQSNRILRNIFNERLQQRVVHHGKVSFQHGEMVI